jgi:hypothetical protein
LTCPKTNPETDQTQNTNPPSLAKEKKNNLAPKKDDSFNPTNDPKKKKKTG